VPHEGAANGPGCSPARVEREGLAAAAVVRVEDELIRDGVDPIPVRRLPQRRHPGRGRRGRRPVLREAGGVWGPSGWGGGGGGVSRWLPRGELCLS